MRALARGINRYRHLVPVMFALAGTVGAVSTGLVLGAEVNSDLLGTALMVALLVMVIGLLGECLWRVTWDVEPETLRTALMGQRGYLVTAAVFAGVAVVGGLLLLAGQPVIARVPVTLGLFVAGLFALRGTANALARSGSG